MLFHAYIDDSADQKRERVVVAAAIIAAPHVCDRMSKRWNARLAQDGIAYFKSSHCETLNGQVYKFRALGMQEGRLKAAKIRDDLDQILLTSDLTALGITLSIPSHRVMLSEPQKIWPRSHGSVQAGVSAGDSGMCQSYAVTGRAGKHFAVRP